MTLALLLMRTHTTADGRKVGGLVDNLHGCAEVALRQLMIELLDMVGDRTSFLTLRHLALQAAFGLVNGLTHREGMAYHLKLIRSYCHYFFTVLMKSMQSRQRLVIYAQSPAATLSFGKSLEPIPTQKAPALNHCSRFSCVGATPPVTMIFDQRIGAMISLTNLGP